MVPTSISNGIAVSFVALSLGLLSACSPRTTVERKPWPTLPEPLAVGPAFAPNPGSGYPRYRYSIVPGGIHDATELAEVTRNDRVVRRHYSGMNLAAVHFTNLEHDIQGFVSYRVGDNVYWTRHRVHIPRGEEIFSDGVRTARVRCGNLISDTPQKPVEPVGPTTPQRNLNQFEPAMDDSAPVMAENYHPRGILAATITPPLSSTVIAPVPEPGTFALYIAGVGFLLIKSIICNQRRRRSLPVTATQLPEADGSHGILPAADPASRS